MRILRIATIIGAIVTGVAALFFYVGPHAQSYWYAPGCRMAFAANSDGHKMRISGIAWNITSVFLNFVFYTAIAYWLVWMVMTLAGKNVAVKNNDGNRTT